MAQAAGGRPYHGRLRAVRADPGGYGWGFWVTRGRDPFWIALSFCGEGPSEEPAEWVVSVGYDPGLNLFKRLFHKPDAEALARVRGRIWQVLGSTPGIRVLSDEDTA